MLLDCLIGNSNFPIVYVSIYIHMCLSIHPAVTCPSIPLLNVCSSIYLHIYCLFHPSFPHPPVHKYLPSFILFISLRHHPHIRPSIHPFVHYTSISSQQFYLSKHPSPAISLLPFIYPSIIIYASLYHYLILSFHPFHIGDLKLSKT